MSDVMLVTVGTSLFHSASWKFDGFVSSQVKKYNTWNEKGTASKPGPLFSPEERIRTGGPIVGQLKDLLKEEGHRAMATHFETDVKKDELMRYSAELSTIFRRAFRFNEDLLAALAKFKDNIWFIADSQKIGGEASDQFLVAQHLAEYLNFLVPGLGAKVLEIPGLSSKAPETFLDKSGKTGIVALFNKVDDFLESAKETDSKLYWIASAGYKIYGIILGPLLSSSNTEIVYQHEDSRLFLRITKDKIISDDPAPSGGPPSGEPGSPSIVNPNMTKKRSSGSMEK